MAVNAVDAEVAGVSSVGGVAGPGTGGIADAEKFGSKKPHTSKLVPLAKLAAVELGLLRVLSHPEIQEVGDALHPLVSSHRARSSEVPAE